MTSQYRHRRTSNPATPAPTLEPGEIAVNTANRQISLGDAAAGTLGTPKPLLAIRIFDIAAIYAIGDMVTNADKIWRAIVANGPGAFNAANWELAASQVTISSNPPSGAVAGSMWWDSDNGMLYVRYNDGDSSQWVQATAMPVVDTSSFVLKAGDTMTGDLVLAKATPAFSLDKTASGLESQIWGKTAGVNRWKMALGDASPETGSHLGSAFTLHSRSDDGTLRQLVLTAPRDTGLLSVAGDPTAALGIATKQYVDARAGDAMAYSGMQINGSMEVSQEVGATAVSITAGSVTNKYAIDGFCITKTGANAFTVQQVASVFVGYAKALKLTVTTAQASIGSDYIVLDHFIEGYRFSKAQFGTAAARPVTVGFWVKSSVTGTLSVQIFNSAFNSSTIGSVTIAAANVAQWVAIVIPGRTTGTWNTDYTIGAIVRTVLADNSGINIAATVGNTFEITGLVVLPGTQAPTAAQSPLLMRPYDQELVTCQRYWQKLGGSNSADIHVRGYATNAHAATLIYPVEMRVSPTAAVVGVWNFANCASFTINSSGSRSLGLQLIPTAVGEVGAWISGVTTYISLDARL